MTGDVANLQALMACLKVSLEFGFQFLSLFCIYCCIGELRALCQTYQERICAIESDKYDTEKRVEFKDYEVIFDTVFKNNFFKKSHFY